MGCKRCALHVRTWLHYPMDRVSRHEQRKQVGGQCNYQQCQDACSRLQVIMLDELPFAQSCRASSRICVAAKDAVPGCSAKRAGRETAAASLLSRSTSTHHLFRKSAKVWLLQHTHSSVRILSSCQAYF